jgi:transmembrane sensor
MDELICRAMHGRASKSEEARLLDWRAESPINDLHYQTTIRLLEGISAAAATAADSAPSFDDLMRRAQRRRQAGFADRRPGQKTVVMSGLAMAAAAALATILLATNEPVPGSPVASGSEARQIVTGRSESATVTLRDGTVVRLAPATTLIVNEEAGAREVWMEGRAYFAVARDEDMPFRVRTPAGDAVVLGTRFDLRASDDALQLLVVEGLVELNAPGGVLSVEASQLARASGSLPLERFAVDAYLLESELSWLGEFIAFQNTPLRLAARELTLHFGIPVAVADSSLALETVTGAFLEEDFEDVLRVICRALSARCDIAPSGVKIGPDPGLTETAEPASMSQPITR